MSPGILLVISPRMQKLTPNPGRDFARVCVIPRFVTSAAASQNNSSGNSAPRQQLSCRTLSQSFRCPGEIHSVNPNQTSVTLSHTADREGDLAKSRLFVNTGDAFTVSALSPSLVSKAPH